MSVGMPRTPSRPMRGITRARWSQQKEDRMAQHIRDVMTPNPVSLPGTASVHEAARAMRDGEMGDVIVIENNRVCGIVTGRDLVVERDPDSALGGMSAAPPDA